MGNPEGPAKAYSMPHSMLGEDCLKTGMARQPHRTGQAAPQDWGDQVSPGTEQQAFLSAMQDSGDLPVSLGELGLLCWPNMARTSAGEGPPRSCPGPIRLSYRGLVRGQVG